MSRQAIAIIGTGIAGMACGHLLHPHHDITLYERNAHVGGHTNTIIVNEGGHELPVDTGFMVYNEFTDPEVTRLFTGLGIATQPVPMSLSVQHVSSGLEFSTAGFKGVFAQPKNLGKLQFWRLLRDIRRFNTESPKIIEDLLFQDHTIREYAQEMGFGGDFLDLYLVPLGSTIWGAPAEQILEFNAVILVRFFQHHGFLGSGSLLSWRTVVGGSRIYRDKIILPFQNRLRTDRPALRITRRPGAVQVIDKAGDAQSFDHVILATHADEALALLADPTPDERTILSHFRYQKNILTLHTDSSVMPRARGAWSSWNYRAEWDRHGQPTASTTCWVNNLQGISDKKDYFVSLHHPGGLSPARVIQTLEYTRPVLSWGALRAQSELPRLNQNGLVSFCGSYWGHGLHEDALQSALAVCRPFVTGV